MNDTCIWQEVLLAKLLLLILLCRLDKVHAELILREVMFLLKFWHGTGW